jgi:hypothetical protein
VLVFIAEADSPEELAKKEKAAYGIIEVIDAHGKSSMRGWKK